MNWRQGEFIQGRYHLGQRLAALGNRQTWLAHDHRTAQTVVLKALRFAPDERLWQEYRLAEREATTLTHVVHPAVPRCLEVFWLETCTDRHFCRVFEYIEGESLAQRVQRLGRLASEEVERIAREVLGVLAVLHGFAPPVVHRDLRPINLICRSGDGQICLVGFGAVQAESGAGRTFTVVGTCGYTAPEQFAGQSTPASDLYGLGATLLHLLTGQDPADWPRQGLRPMLNPSAVPDERLRLWMGRLLEPEPANRFFDAATALNALRLDGKTSLSLLRVFERECLSVKATPGSLHIEIAPPRGFKALAALVVTVFYLGVVFAGSSLLMDTQLEYGPAYRLFLAGFLIPYFSWQALLLLRFVAERTRLTLWCGAGTQERVWFGFVRRHHSLAGPLRPMLNKNSGGRKHLYTVCLTRPNGRVCPLSGSLDEAEAMDLVHTLSLGLEG